MNRTASRSAPRRGEHGFSEIELIILTVPLCLLSMVLTSRLAATSRAKAKAQWQAAVAAQTNAKNLCGASDAVSAPWQNSTSRQNVNNLFGTNTPGKLDLAANANIYLSTTTNTGDVASMLAHISHVGNIISGTGLSMNQLADITNATTSMPADLLQQKRLVDTNWTVQGVSSPLDSFYYQALSNQVLPKAPTNVTANAAFICQDPGVNSVSLTDLNNQLLVWAFDEANKFFIP